MTTASPTSDGDGVEFSDDDPRANFQSAREFFERESHVEDDDAPNYAHGIVWFDQTTPLFVCCPCHEQVADLRHAGDDRADDPDQVRGRAYRRLFEESPRCDACAGTLPEKVDR